VYYAPGTGHVFMRSSWSKDATWANFIAGPYTESHAHQDQGSFLIYKKGWLAYDENVATHSGIQQGTNMHNLVRLVRNGTPMPQREGSKPGKLFGLRDDATLTYLASDLAPVYDDTYVAAVERRMLFIKPDLFVIFDLVSSSGDLDTVWQLNTPINPTIDTGVATLSGPNATLRVEMLEPESGSFETIGWTGQDDITGGGYQLQFSQKGTTNRYLTVLSLDGALTSAIRTTDLDSIGATLTLADGRTVHVRFTNLNHGTTVVIEQGGSEIYNESFDETLQELPRFAN
ncbi:MAG: hypothetical protein KC609_09270, partial [Myxococcales bacterium]|nr:hypothetical protein [Myxococcales bacterium]